MRYKGAYGGRGGAKSHFFAEEIILRCYERHTRVVCIREVQDSIKDSVRQLLVDKIAKLGLESSFQVLDSEIRGPGGSLIIFKGMQSYNADNIKSLEAYDIAWVEEAQTLSQHSLDMLRPTIRKDGSELWFSWNPRFRTDPVDVFFRKQYRDNAIAVPVNWRDNPWFPDVLRKEMEDDFREDEDKAEHVWEGAYGSPKGSILGKWVSKARRENRIHPDVVFDPDGAKIEISSDIGFHDTAAWWFWQRAMGGYRVFAYTGASGFDAEDWCVELESHLERLNVPRKMLGKIWLPHDARAKTFQSKHSSVERFIHHFGMPLIGIVPVSSKPDRISAARLVIASCEINSVECEVGINGLAEWRYKLNEETQELSRDPFHGPESHPSDAFSYGAQVMKGLGPAPTQDNAPRHTEVGPGNTLRLDDAWATRSIGGGDRI
jgi:phage terminase large subunit